MKKVAGIAKDSDVPYGEQPAGSMFTWFFTAGPVTNWDSASKSDTKAFARFFRSMLDHGVYLPPSQYEAAFLSTAHSEDDIQHTIAAAKQALHSGHGRKK